MIYAEVYKNNKWELIDIKGFEALTKGIKRNDWLNLRCEECKQPVYFSGELSPSANVYAQFKHNPIRREDGEAPFCELRSANKDLKYFIGNELVSQDVAIQRRLEFYDVNNIKEVYCFCRKILGGDGCLSQNKFIKSLKLADSADIWRYQYLPTWGIGFILLLLNRHETPNGKSHFFYKLNKKNGNMSLNAYWIDNGKIIDPDKYNRTKFLLCIPFSERKSSEISEDIDTSWINSENFSALFNYLEKQADS